MKHKLLPFTAAALLLAAASACNKAQDFNFAIGAQDVTAPITIHTVLYDTHVGVDSVKVEIVGHNKSALSNASGTTTFELGAGTYEARISRDGYLPIIQTFTVDLANTSSSTPILTANIQDVLLYPLTGSITGFVTRQINNQPSYQDQSQISVAIQFTGTEQTDASYTATTDANGTYTISQLPEGLTLTVNGSYVAQEEDNLVYEGTASVQALRANVLTKVTTIPLARTANSYTHDILSLPQQPLDPLTITFPVAADVEQITYQNISVTRGTTSTEVGITTTWSNGNRTLTINTVDPNGWSTDATAGTYSFTVSVPNIEGGTLTSSGTFSVVPEMGQLTPVTATFDATTLTISWPKLSNALSYHIYLKVSNESDYRLFYTYTPTSTTATTESISANTLITQNNNTPGLYNFKIVGVNDRFEGDLSAATTVVVPYLIPDVQYTTNTLTWTAIAGVTEYQIYEKGTGNSYTLISTVAPAANANTISVDTTTLPFQTTGTTTHTVKVVGVIDGIIGNLNMATDVTIN